MPHEPVIYTKELLIEKLREIVAAGWIASARPGNQGAIGNTLEDLLGIKENNLPIPNAAEWELKTQALHTTSLTTLFHLEPSPRALKFVAQILLPKYGWAHKEDGKRYPIGELSFRQTINGLGTVRSRLHGRGRIEKSRRSWFPSMPPKLVFVTMTGFNRSKEQQGWRNSIRSHIGASMICGIKLVQSCRTPSMSRRRWKRGSRAYIYKYEKVTMLQQFSFDGFLRAIETGKVLIDFDARSGHNHGTKFRLRQENLPLLYNEQKVVIQ